jgi:uncharacterized membrane protein
LSNAQVGQEALDGGSAYLSRGDVQAPENASQEPRDRVPWLIAAAVFIAYLMISLWRYLRFDPTSWDLGIFTEYVKQYGLFRAPIVDARMPGIDLLGDHFHPIVALIGPFFDLFPTPVTLLVCQALLTAISVIPVSRVARELLGVAAGRAIGIAYGFSWGLQELVNNDFHEVAFAVPLLAFSLSALVSKRIRAAVLWALPLVFVKEDQGFTIAVIGLIIAIGYRHKLAGLGLAFWGVAWSLLAIMVIIPHFNPHHVYPYWSTGGHWDSPGAFLDQIFTGSQTKLTTLALMLLPTAFLALRSPLILAVVPGLALRFIAVDSSYWGTAWHYNATAMPIVFIAAVDGIARIRAYRARYSTDADDPVPGGLASWLERHGAAMMVGICAALAFQFPLSDLWNPQTYQPGPHAAAARAAVALVPAGATVEANIDLLAPLGAKSDAFWLGNSSLWLGTAGDPATQYVVYDTSCADMPAPQGSLLAWVEKLNNGAAYRLIYSSDTISVFRRVP